jgi:hypothetical protein
MRAKGSSPTSAIVPPASIANNKFKAPAISNFHCRDEDVNRAKSLPCDIFLGAHGAYFGLEEKYARMKDGAANPFIDPGGYKEFVVQKEQDFRAELAKQTLAGK